MAVEKSKKIVVPVLVVLAIALIASLGACGWLFMTNQKTAQRADLLEQATAGIIEKAGLTEMNAASLKTADTLPDTLNQIVAAVEAKTAELATTKESLATASAQALAARTEAAEATEKLPALTAQAEAATQALATKEAEVATAKAEMETARKGLQEQVDKVTAELTTAQTEVQSGKQRVEKLLTVMKEAGLEEPAEAPAAEVTGTEKEAAPETATTEEAAATAEKTPEEAPAEEEDATAQAQTAGLSEMFKGVRYNNQKQTLEFTLVNGVVLIFSEVPESIYAGLQQATDMDVYYRFRIAGVFTSKPDDNKAIADLWRKTLRGDKLSRKPVKFSP